MILDAIVSLTSLIAPPVFDFIKKKFIKPSNDSPAATLSSLALTKPEVIPAYIEAQVKLLDAKIRLYNRDVIGKISSWVSNFRALIRPLYIVYSLIFLTLAKTYGWEIDPFFRYLMESCVGSWFGSRLI